MSKYTKSQLNNPHSRAGEASTVLVKGEQLVLLELLGRLDPGVGGGNLVVEGKRGRRALSTSCWPS